MKDIIYIILTLATATSIVTENRSRQDEGTYLEFYSSKSISNSACCRHSRKETK